MQEISPLIDSCVAMIHRNAYNGYNRLPERDRRHTDLEDLLQEGFLTALQAERDWEPDGGNRYSTHLYQALEWHTNSIMTSLKYQKRSAIQGIVELDAPAVQDDPGGVQVIETIPDYRQTVGNTLESARTAFVEVFRAVQVRSKMFMVAGLLCKKRVTQYGAETLADIRREAGRLRVGLDDLLIAVNDPEISRELLTYAGEAGNMGLEAEEALRVLECVECEGQFTLGAVRRKRFVVATMTCRTCLEKLAKDRLTCFGKRKTPEHEGYSLQDAECRLHCIDRKACRNFDQESNCMGVEDLEKELAEVDKTTAEKAKTAKKSNKKVKAKAAAKAEQKSAKSKPKVKAAKKEYPEEPKTPKGVTEWPYKRGSVMRWAFQLCENGISAKDFTKKVGEYASHPSITLDALRKQHYPYKGPKYTHLWKFDEEGGRYKIHDIRQVGANKEKSGKEKSGNGVSAGNDKKKTAKTGKKTETVKAASKKAKVGKKVQKKAA